MDGLGFRFIKPSRIKFLQLQGNKRIFVFLLPGYMYGEPIHIVEYIFFSNFFVIKAYTTWNLLLDNNIN